MAYEDPEPTITNLFHVESGKLIKDMSIEELQNVIVKVQKEVEFLLPHYRSTLRPDANVIRTLIAIHGS